MRARRTISECPSARDAAPAREEPWCAPRPPTPSPPRIRTPPSPPLRAVPAPANPADPSPRVADDLRPRPRNFPNLPPEFLRTGQGCDGGRDVHRRRAPAHGVREDRRWRGRHLPLFTSGDTLSGHVHLPAPGKRVDHLGVKVEILGQIELYFDAATRISSLVRELAPRGDSTDRSPSRSSFRASNSRTRRTRASTFGFAISCESPCSARTETRRCPKDRFLVAVWASRRDQQQHQDGSWHRRLSAYRVRVRQGEVPPSRRGGGKDLLPVGAHQDQTHGG